ncbi:MAG TPA: bifunctional oligoribonuclease/PAP phosphatase NrnA [Acetivibrio sp.]|jgi:phosphoesterase RecJ-like protein|nr:bifunctional oligoribonuclease/PAP phosphatase NrnA [Clostridium sp.]HOQ36444.1 bifunctional oligoribonuclease/PAP phosphatase NrnA [Acetivibrio sp.]HQA57129.1 bifunctional oligoribonuclease/PAP phosphatase NrnA [Acetivibrio sp.]
MVENRIIKLINEAERIAILPHVSADGDALGSSLALAIALRTMDKVVTVYLEEEIPSIYSFLPGRESAQVYGEKPDKYELVLALDTGDLERLGRRIAIFEEADKTVNIDHHTTNTEFARLNLVKVSSSAVGEIIYQLIKMMGIALDKDMATCLYVAIATDTGGFRYSNTTPITHQISADLINNGVDVANISQLVFETTSLPKVKLMGKAIDNMELLENGKLAFIYITDEMLKSIGAVEEDCDGLVNIGRNIEGVEVSILIRQRGDDEYKINFRSKSYVDVSSIANRHSGGGHVRAAGCTVKGDINEIKNALIKEIREVL